MDVLKDRRQQWDVLGAITVNIFLELFHSRGTTLFTNFKNYLMKKIFLIFLIINFSNLFSQNGVVNYGYIQSLTIGNAIGDDYNSILK